jgi:hypothetical protein
LEKVGGKRRKEGSVAAYGGRHSKDNMVDTFCNVDQRMWRREREVKGVRR